MTIKIFCALVLMAGSTLTSAASVDNKTQLAMKVLDITHYSTMMKGMTEQIRGVFEKQFAAEESCEAAKPIVTEFAQKLSDQLSADLSSDDFKADIGAIYAETFSEQELGELISFYQSPLGQKMLARMPELMSKTVQMSQQRVKSMQPQIQKLTADYTPRIREAAKTCNATATPVVPSKK